MSWFFDIHFGVGHLLKNATMLAGYLNADYIDGVYWTLQVEIKFYVIVFFLLLIKQIDRSELWAYGWLFLTLLHEVTNVVPKGLILFPYGSYFIAGMVLFQIWKFGQTRMRLIAFLVALAISARHAFSQVHEFVPSDADPWVPVLVISLIHAALFLVATRKIVLRANPIWTWLGASTYPLYLLHNSIGRALFSSFSEQSNLVALSITLAAISIIVAAAATMIDNKMHRWTRSALTSLFVRPSASASRTASH